MYNLLLYDKDLNVKYLINYVDRELKEGIYNEEYRYIKLEQKMFDILSKKLLDNNIKLSQTIFTSLEITLNDFTLKPIIRPITPTQALSKGLFENTLNEMDLQMKVNALSKALFTLTLNNKGE